jgi:hypothetical protein
MAKIRGILPTKILSIFEPASRENLWVVRRRILTKEELTILSRKPLESEKTSAEC